MKLGCALLFCIALQAPTALAQETRSFFGGSIGARGMVIGSQGAAAMADGLSWASATTLAASLGVKGQRSRAEASFEAAALGGSAAAIARAASATPASQVFLVGSADAAASLRIRTLWARLDLEGANLQIGRQVVNYGRAAFWSPADLFATLDLTGISPDRLGIDALRLRVPLADLAGLDLVAAPLGDPTKGRYAARFSAAALGLDGGLLAAWDGSGAPGRLVAAGDCKFDLGASYYGEALWSVDPSAIDKPDGSRVRAAAGFDWSRGDLIVAGEYYFNGGGAKADVSFPSRHHVFAAASWAASDFTKLTVTAISAPESGALRGQLLCSVDSSQNSTLAFFGELSRGSFVQESADGITGHIGATLSVKF
ncbi:MAG: hypothetical protein WCL50_00930 [Spirochaetota bacterium]